MSSAIEKALTRISNEQLLSYFNRLQRGLEKESLRVNAHGKLAQTPHPKALGSALTHPIITTDYSEALLEFVTPIHTEVDTLLQELANIHHYTYQHIGDEKLWVNSMPCVVEGEENIPIACYGRANVAKMKEAYRRGLGHRYGRLMQTIAGIHFNFSMPDDFWDMWLNFSDTGDRQSQKSARYFGLTRNFLRHSWLPCYLFGASPAVCKSFLKDRQHNLPDHDLHSLFSPWATSLRLSDLGYSNNAQAGINVCYNELDQYVDTLRQAITTPHSKYEEIPLVVNHKYQQLNPNLLQIENEFYAAIRPKQVAQSGESPSIALLQRGVEYVEVRSLDLDPYCPVGIDADCVRFFDTLLVFCLLDDSPQMAREEQQQSTENRKRTVMRGRETGLQLEFAGQAVDFSHAANELLDSMAPVADLLDEAHQTSDYTKTLSLQKEKIVDAALTPSARVLAEMNERFDSFYAFAMNQAEKHESYFKSRSISPADLNSYQQQAKESIDKQHAIEQADDQSFEDYLADYVRRQNA